MLTLLLALALLVNDCNRCGAPIRDGLKFCTQCGQKVEPRSCPKCKTPAEPTDKFCGGCGGSLSKPEELSAGYKMLDAGDYEGALRFFTNAVVEHPHNAQVYGGRARAHLGLDQLDKALDDANRAVALVQDASLYELRAEIKLRLAVDPVGDLDTALKLEPKRAPALRLRCRAYTWRARGNPKPDHDIQRAIEDATLAAELEPKSAAALILRGHARLVLLGTSDDAGILAKALSDFDRAIEVDPKSVDAYLGRAEAWWIFASVRQSKGEDPSKGCQSSIGDATRALELNPKSTQALILRGHARVLSGDKTGAIADYEAALKLDPRLEGSLRATIDRLGK